MLYATAIDLKKEETISNVKFFKCDIFKDASSYTYGTSKADAVAIVNMDNIQDTRVTSIFQLGEVTVRVFFEFNTETKEIKAGLSDEKGGEGSIRSVLTETSYLPMTRDNVMINCQPRQQQLE